MNIENALVASEDGDIEADSTDLFGNRLPEKIDRPFDPQQIKLVGELYR